MFGYRKLNIFIIVTAIFFISMDVAVLLDQLTLAPWLSLLLVLFFSLFLFLRGNSEGFPIYASIIIAPFLLSFIIILFREDIFAFFKNFPVLSLSLKPSFLWFILCFLATLLLVLVFKYDLRFDKSIDRSYYNQYPAISKIISIVKILFRYVLISSVLTLLISWIWNKIPQLPEFFLFPPYDFSSFQLNKLATLDWFWRANAAMVIILFIIDIIRSLRKPLWDVFISYKSKNVDLARAIADRLIASGLNVWFAEYQILLVGRDRFQQAIDKGIRQSKYGIALTNDDYARSDYCGLEMKQLLQYCSPKRIIEIKIPDEPLTHKKYANLSKAPSQLYRGNLDDIFKFISQKTGWRIVPPLKIQPAPDNDIFVGDCLGQPYHLDVSGWQLVEKSFHGGGPCYRRKIENHEIFWNLQYGEEFSPDVYESRTKQSTQDDRALYNTLVDYAIHYFRDLKSGSEVHGVHLFFLKGFSHFAVTYKASQIWKRRYSIMLIHPIISKAAEFIFTFEFTGPFHEYCRASYLMDELVRSFEWEEQGKEKFDNSIRELPSTPSIKDDRLSRIMEDQPLANKLNAEGLAYAKQGKLEQAIASWEQVLNYSNLSELTSSVMFNLGRAYEKMGDTDKAIKNYQSSIDLNPVQFNSLCNIGTIYIDKGEYEKALENLLAAARINPQDYITVNNISLCYTYLSKFEEASRWREKLETLSM